MKYFNIFQDKFYFQTNVKLHRVFHMQKDFLLESVEEMHTPRESLNFPILHIQYT